LKRSRAIGCLLFALTAAVLAGLYSLIPISHYFENRFGLSLLYTLRQPISAPTGAVVVGIDRETLDWLRDEDAPKSRLLACLPGNIHGDLKLVRGPSSIPRAVHACLLDELARSGFPVVVFDILFAVRGAAEDDLKLASALRSHGSAVMLIGFERSVVNEGGSQVLVEREILPHKLFVESAASVGAFTIPRSGGPVYGYWRRVPGFPTIKSLPEEALALLRNVIKESGTTNSERLFSYFWVYGPPGTVETLSARDVLQSEVPDRIRQLANHSVAFIGASDPAATNFPDTFPSYFQSGSGAEISGVELAATAYLNLLHTQNLHRLSPLVAIVMVVIFAGVSSYIARAKSGFAMIAVPAATLAYVAISSVTFNEMRLFLPIATPVFVIAPAAFITALLSRYRFVRNLILRVEPAPVARRLLANMLTDRGTAISGEATVVFFDLIGSTAIGETIRPVAFSTLLNKYNEAVTRAVVASRGFVSAFSGDGVTAVFTQQDAGADHAANACGAALSAINKIQILNEANAREGLPSLAMRIGINSGVVAEGEMGASDRFNFSVVGDVVNLAARLEQLGKTLFPGEKNIILVGSTTKQMVEAKGFTLTDCGLRKISGREQPERVHRLELEHIQASTLI
jgi:adenylate cyclase